MLLVGLRRSLGLDNNKQVSNALMKGDLGIGLRYPDYRAASLIGHMKESLFAEEPLPQVRLAPLHTCGRFRREAGSRKGRSGPSRERSSAAPILAQDREQEVVLPFAVDQQIAAGVAFLLEAGAHSRARLGTLVGRQAASTRCSRSRVEGESSTSGNAALM